MGVVIRQSLKASIASYAGVVIGAFNLLILFTAFLEPEEIGLRDVMLGAALWFATFSQLGIGSVAIRYFPFFENDEKKHHGFLVLLLLIPLIGFTLVGIILLVFDGAIIEFYREGAELLTKYYYYLLPLTFFMTYSLVLEAYSRAHLRVTIPVFLKEVVLKLMTTILVICYAQSWISFELLIQLMVGSYGLQCLFLVAYIKSMGKWYISWPRLKDAGKSLGDIYTYTLWMMFGVLGIAGADLIDKFMLSKFDLAMTGIYSISFFMAVVVELPRRSLSQIVTPLLARAHKDNDIDELENLYKKTAVNQFIAGALVFTLIWFSVDHFFELMSKTEIFRQGKWVVLFIGIGKLVDMGTGPNYEIIINSKYYRFNIVLIFLLAALTIFTNYLLIPILGITGAAIATCISVVIYNLIKLWYVKAKYGLLPFTKELLLTALILVVLLLLSFGIPRAEGGMLVQIAFILIKSIVISCIFIFALFRLRLSEDAIGAIFGLKKYLPRFKK